MTFPSTNIRLTVVPWILTLLDGCHISKSQVSWDLAMSIADKWWEVARWWLPGTCGRIPSGNTPLVEVIGHWSCVLLGKLQPIFTSGVNSGVYFGICHFQFGERGVLWSGLSEFSLGDELSVAYRISGQFRLEGTSRGVLCRECFVAMMVSVASSSTPVHLEQ